MKESNTAKFPVLQDDSLAWYNIYAIIAHGGGAICGRTMTNSIDAWKESYKNGVRVFDVDLVLTSDSMVVCRHDWNDYLGQRIPIDNNVVHTYSSTLRYEFITVPNQSVPSYMEFLSTPIWGAYTPSTINEMISFLKKHEDVVFVLDFKGDISKIVKALKNQLRNTDVLKNRIVYSINDKQQLKILDELISDNYNCIYKMYIQQDPLYVLDICTEHDIHVVNIAQGLITQDIVELYKKHNVHVFVAVVNMEQELMYYVNMGCSGFVSDFLAEPF